MTDLSKPDGDTAGEGRGRDDGLGALFCDAAGHPGAVRRPAARLVAGTGALRRFARAKLTDVTALRAEFGGEGVVMEPWLSLYVESLREASFLGVYRSESSQDGDDEDGNGDADDADAAGADAALPDLCWRCSTWQRDADLARIRAVESRDRRAYLAGTTQLDSRIGFTRLERQPRLAALIQAGVELFRGGVTVAAALRPTAPWHQVTIEVTDDRATCSVATPSTRARHQRWRSGRRRGGRRSPTSTRTAARDPTGRSR
jgi:hypothetical protein